MANEKRLISVEGFKGAFHVSTKKGKEEICFWNGEAFVAFGAVTRALENAPTVDAVEVVHGRWEDEYGGKYANPRYRCSVCKKKALYKFERDLLDNWKEVQALTPHCPYCMAKLEGGTDYDI